MTDKREQAGARSRRKPDAARSCPICGKPAIAERRPFCSARCQAIDLGRWFGEDYRLPSDEAPFTDSE